MDKVVFLDRDGVLNIEVNYLDNPDKIRLYRGTKEALELLKEYGYKVYVVTNQSGVGRGYFTEETLILINEKLNELVDKNIDQFFYCPHTPLDNCDCRKPNIGMVKDIKFNADESYLIGDKSIDMQMGKKLGVKTIAVLTGYGQFESADFVCQNLFEAVRKIICK